MLSPRLKSDIRELWNDFWAGGLSNPITAIEQITYLIFLKRLEDLDNQRQKDARKNDRSYTSVYEGDFELLQTRRTDESKEAPKIPKAHFRWSHIKTLKDDALLQHIRGPVFDWLKLLDESGERMRDAVFVIPNASLLERAIEKIDQLFIEERNQDTVGDIYEMLLSEIAEAGKNGQFRTPRHLIRAMCDLVDVKMGDKVCDPACGTSGFLINAFQHVLMQQSEPDQLQFLADGTPLNANGNKLKQHPDWSAFFYGFDIDRTMVRLGWMNMILHGLENPNIEYANTLGKRWNGNVADSGQWRGAFDVVLANPPFAAKLDKNDLGATLAEAGTNQSELLFLELILQLLNPDTGRAAVIVPEGVLFGSSKAHRNLREKLVKENNLKAIISLPNNVFQPYSGVKTSIIVFERGSVTEQVWFYEVANDGYTLNAKRAEDFDHNDLWDMQVQFRLRYGMPPPAFVEASTPELWKELQDTDANTYFQPIFAEFAAEVEADDEQETSESISTLSLESLTTKSLGEDKHWRATAVEIIDNAYNMSANRYKPFALQAVEYDEPQDIISDLRTIEKDIVEGLKRLENRLKANS